MNRKGGLGVLQGRSNKRRRESEEKKFGEGKARVRGVPWGGLRGGISGLCELEKKGNRRGAGGVFLQVKGWSGYAGQTVSRKKRDGSRKHQAGKNPREKERGRAKHGGREPSLW